MPCGCFIGHSRKRGSSFAGRARPGPRLRTYCCDTGFKIWSSSTSTGLSTKAARRGYAPAEFNLATEGRDLWRWTIGETTYWLTQTVKSGRYAHIFNFTLLAADREKKLRHASLIENANLFETARSGANLESKPFELLELGVEGLDGMLGHRLVSFDPAGRGLSRSGP